MQRVEIQNCPPIRYMLALSSKARYSVRKEAKKRRTEWEGTIDKEFSSEQSRFIYSYELRGLFSLVAPFSFVQFISLLTPHYSVGKLVGSAQIYGLKLCIVIPFIGNHDAYPYSIYIAICATAVANLIRIKHTHTTCFKIRVSEV